MGGFVRLVRYYNLEGAFRLQGQGGPVLWEAMYGKVDRPKARIQRLATGSNPHHEPRPRKG